MLSLNQCLSCYFIFPILIVFGQSTIAKAQTIPTIPEQIPPLREPLPSPTLKPQPLNPVLPLTPPPGPSPTGLPQQPIRVSKFIITGNNVIDSTRIQSILSTYLNRELNSYQLNEALHSLINEYQEQGYLLAVATIPAASNQNLNPKAALINVVIIEGQVTSLEFSGNGKNQSFVQGRLKHLLRRPYNSRKLEEELRFLSANPLIRQIRTSLQPGLPGEGKLLVFLEGDKAEQLVISTNNYRSPAVGSWERRVEFSHQNLGGIGDSFQVIFRNTNGSNALQLSYEVPITPYGTLLQGNYTYAKSEIVEPPFNTLDLQTNFQNLDLGIRQNIWRRANNRVTQKLDTGITLSLQNSESFLLGQPFPLSLGADENGETRLRALRWFTEFSNQGSRHSFLLRAEFSIGLGSFLGGTINPDGPDNRFTSWRGQAIYLRRLPKNLLLLSRSSLQFGDRALLPTEQFTLGGDTTVRGYRNDLSISDSGIQSSLELQIPIYSGRLGEFTTSPFIDFGYGFNNQNPQPFNPQPSSPLLSTGISLNYNFSKRLSASLILGIPILNPGGERRQWQQDLGIGFEIRTRAY